MLTSAAEGEAHAYLAVLAIVSIVLTHPVPQVPSAVGARGA